jgi:hypothetical protein
MFAKDARLSRLVLRPTQYSKVLKASVFTHFIAEVFGVRTAARPASEPNVRSDLHHEAPHATQRSELAGVFQQICGAPGANQSDSLGRPVNCQ